MFWTLREEIGESAIHVLVALWTFCEEQGDEFQLPSPQRLARICRWTGDADQLWRALAEPSRPWIDRIKADRYRAHDWMEVNQSLLNARERAKKAAAARWGSDDAEADAQADAKTQPKQMLGDDQANAQAPPKQMHDDGQADAQAMPQAMPIG